MALQQVTSPPSFTGIAAMQHRQRKRYGEQLRRHSLLLDIDAWLRWFPQHALQTQAETD